MTVTLVLPPVDLEFLDTIHTNGSVWGIPYVWGAKPHPQQDTNKISGSDCSGWFNYLMTRATAERPFSDRQKMGLGILDLGSQEQMAALESHDLPTSTDYAAVAGSQGLFACFALDTRNSGGHAGHIWLCERGTTMECFGGHGVGSRPWNTRVLLRIFHRAFRLPTR